MKKLTVKEYKRHFEDVDHAEYVQKVTHGGHKNMNPQRLHILKRGKKSEKLLRKHGLVGKEGQLIYEQKSKIKKKIIKWGELMYC